MADWFESLEVGGEYRYREEGGETIVLLANKALDESHKWMDLRLRAIQSVHPGKFGPIAAGEEWTVGAALLDSGPYAYCGWSITKVKKNG